MLLARWEEDVLQPAPVTVELAHQVAPTQSQTTLSIPTLITPAALPEPHAVVQQQLLRQLQLLCSVHATGAQVLPACHILSAERVLQTDLVLPALLAVPVLQIRVFVTDLPAEVSGTDVIIKAAAPVRQAKPVPIISV